MSQRLARNAALDPILARPFMGAEGEGDPNEDPNANGENGNGDGEGDPTDDGKPKGEAVTREEFDKLFARMQAADRRATAAEQKAKQYEDKDKTELEKASGRVTELESENAALKEQLNTVRRENAFYGNNSVTWHNPSLAIKELDWDGVVKEDGDIDAAALKRAIEALSKSMPFLVKTEETGKGKTPPAGPPTGTPAGSGKQNGKQSDNRDALLKKYPALRK